MKEGEKYPILKRQLIERLTRKTSNVFWNSVDYLSCKIDKLAELYELSISMEYERESKMFNIKKGNYILHIGCGAYPITALTLTKNNSIKVTAIDRSRKAVERAKNIVHKKNLDKKITIEHGDGTNYPVEKFDTIIVSGCAVPKLEILKHVFESTKSESKIVVREMNMAANTIVDLVGSYQDIDLIERIKNRPFSSFDPLGWQSFYLIKK